VSRKVREKAFAGSVGGKGEKGTNQVSDEGFR
jgi:hypothetical protein